jgi:hypothetical protein
MPLQSADRISSVADVQRPRDPGGVERGDIGGGTGDGLLKLPFAHHGPQRRVTASCAAPNELRAASSAASFARQ